MKGGFSHPVNQKRLRVAKQSLLPADHAPGPPSAPKARRRPNSEGATARATTQDTVEPQRMRQACSARRRRSGSSPRARALASNLMKSWDLLDQRLPTSTPNITSLLYRSGRIGAGYRRSFRHRAASKTTPALSPRAASFATRSQARGEEHSW